MPRLTLPAVALLTLALAGCGGGGGHHTEATQSVRIAGDGTTLPGGTVTFVAYVEGGGSVTWSTNGGTITSVGVYTAPTTQGTYTVTATVGGKTATAQVVVTNGISIALTAPTTVPLTISKSTLKFTAAVTGTTDTVIDWSVAGQTGAITADGTFTAPATAGFYIVIGTSHADPTKTVSAAVQVAANVNVRMVWTDFGGATRGTMVFTLLPVTAPNTVANFVSLVNKGFYTGLKIHRYEANFVVQFGSPLSRTATLAQLQDFNGSGINNVTSTTSVPFENSGQSNVKYTLAAASTSAPGAAGDQVFINLTDNQAGNGFDGKYDAFGKVTSAGESVVDALRAGDTIVSATTELP